MANPKNYLPDLLRTVPLSERRHSGKSHAVGDDKVDFRVRHLLGVAGERRYRRIEIGVQPASSATVKSVAHGAMRVVVVTAISEVLKRRSKGILLIRRVKPYPTL